MKRIIKKNEHKNLIEDVKKILNDPVFSASTTFDMEESKLHYNLHAEEFYDYEFEDNCAVAFEEEVFEFLTLHDLADRAFEAKTLVKNLIEKNYIKGIDFEINQDEGHIIISWKRLMTFNEWMNLELENELLNAYEYPMYNACKFLEGKLGVEGYITSGMVEAFIDGKIDEETLKELANDDCGTMIEGDMVEDIKSLKNLVYDKEADEVINKIFND